MTKARRFEFEVGRLTCANSIFSFFLQEDIELNPEFAVLGINLVTLYLTLEEIPFALNVREAFLEVVEVKN